MKMESNNVVIKLLLGVASLALVHAVPASASTLTAVVNTGGTVTFTAGAISGISGWTLGGFDGYTTGVSQQLLSGSVAYSSGSLIFSGTFGTAAGVLSGYSGTLLTISLTGDTVSGSPNNLVVNYGAATGLLSPTIASDLGVETVLANFSNTFSTNSCSTGPCTETGGQATLTGTYGVSSNTNVYTTTPEPRSSFLFASGLLVIGFCIRKLTLRPSTATEKVIA